MRLLPLSITTGLMSGAAAFHCSSDALSTDLSLRSNSIATTFRAMDGTFVFDRPCSCEADWSDTFCSRVQAYKRMPSEEAPSICICRQFDGIQSGCAQFLTRCFPGSSRALHSFRSRRVSATHKNENDTTRRCSCCFNQPDSHCRQLDCDHLKPEFGANANTTCMCYRSNNYPPICSPPSPQKANSTTSGKLAKSLALADENAEEKADDRQQHSWPFDERIVFMEHQFGEENGGSSALNNDHNNRVDADGSWLGGGVVVVPTLIAVLIAALSLLGFACILFLLMKVQIRRRRSAAKRANRRPDKAGHGSPTQRASVCSKSPANARRSVQINTKPQTSVEKFLQHELVDNHENVVDYSPTEFYHNSNCKKETIFV
ncbi:hypothetical protein M3Y99_00314000 [Aphelenchoides fujianensis]|nr:hypothetical protein M3Y99_00314000 [Aphelenchoides fujianensis]